jgi:hypothetical protein
MKLRELAHARAGDKGNVSNISVIAHELGDYAFLAEHVTAARVKAHFADIVKGAVERHELPALGALNFVLHEALGGGVPARSGDPRSAGETRAAVRSALPGARSGTAPYSADTLLSAMILLHFACSALT